MAKVTQTLPTGKVVSTFIPNDDFFCDEMKSQYVKDLTYYVREGNDRLSAKVSEWIDNKSVRAGG